MIEQDKEIRLSEKGDQDEQSGQGKRKRKDPEIRREGRTEMRMSERQESGRERLIERRGGDRRRVWWTWGGENERPVE